MKNNQKLSMERQGSAMDEISKPRFELGIARSQVEIRESQRLRYRVFCDELGAAIAGGADGLDQDQYDRYCEHLLVRDASTGQVIASTRVLTDESAADAGGFYSSGEFDLAMFDSLPGRKMEIGRTCVDPAHRSGSAIATLWQGIASLVVERGYDYLFGCASISLEAGAGTAHAILDTVRSKHMADQRHRVRPYFSLPAPDMRVTEKVRLPPLLKAYLSLGAKACGEAHWDREFNCADVFMLLNVSELNPRYSRHFLSRGTPRPERRITIG